MELHGSSLSFFVMVWYYANPNWKNGWALEIQVAQNGRPGVRQPGSGSAEVRTTKRRGVGRQIDTIHPPQSRSPTNRL
jgi:hypothetical protein